jgi:hypothetical protein
MTYDNESIMFDVYDLCDGVGNFPVGALSEPRPRILMSMTL